METLATMLANALLGILALLSVIGLALGFSLLMAIPFMYAWDYVMPYLFGLKELTLLQAFCLLFVSSSLIKSSLTTKS